MRILLVDDQQDVRETIAQALKYMGFVVDDYAAADDALGNLSPETRPDLLVTDIDLGLGLDGFAFAETARQHCPSLPVLFISGRRHSPPKDHASMFLSKPFRLADLQAAIGTLTSAAGVACPT